MAKDRKYVFPSSSHVIKEFIFVISGSKHEKGISIERNITPPILSALHLRQSWEWRIVMVCLDKKKIDKDFMIKDYFSKI